MGKGLTLTGDKKLAKQFRKVGEAVQGATLAQAAREAAELVVARARARAPRRTGKVKASITRKAVRRSTTQVVENVGYDGVFYGHFQEFGTKHHRAQPHLQEALKSQRGRVVDRIRDVLRRAIRRV